MCSSDRRRLRPSQGCVNAISQEPLIRIDFDCMAAIFNLNFDLL